MAANNNNNTETMSASTGTDFSFLQSADFGVFGSSSRYFESRGTSKHDDEHEPPSELHPDTSRLLLAQLLSPTADDSLADCVLVSSEGSLLKAHKHVLSVSIPYLEKLFRYYHSDLLKPIITLASNSHGDKSEGTTDDRLSETTLSCCPSVSVVESEGGTRRLHVHTEFRESLLKLVLEYAYTKRITALDIENAIDLIPLADQWNSEGLIEECSRHLKALIDCDNCLLFYHYTRLYNCNDLNSYLRSFLLDNIEELQHSVSLYQLSGEDVADLLNDDKLNVSTEETVWRLITNWIQPSNDLVQLTEQRIALFPMLFDTFRYGLCPSLLSEAGSDYIGNHPLIKDGQQSMVLELVQKASADIQTSTAEVFDLQQKPYRPRLPRDIIFAVGGWMDGIPIPGIETYDCKSNRWFPLNNEYLDANPRAYHGMVEYNGIIYVVGGFDGTEYYNSVRCYDVGERRWKESAPMYVARCYVSAAVLNEHVYAVGGYDGRMRLRSVERYDPSANQWSLIQPMHRARSDASAAVYKGRLYVAGGFNGEDVLNDVEYYCVESKSWHTVQALPTPRSGVNMAVVNDCLIVIGGFDGQNRLATGVRYDNGSWLPTKPMRFARSNFAVAVLAGRLYAIGGFDGQTTVGYTESYDAQTDSWHEHASMALFRSAVKAVTVIRCPRADLYSFHGHAN